ncbi:S8 family peptidase [bacterium SCSIO 12643]|nr:S8 family peptidase [bacterium SCSIO 12643]
MRNKIWSLALLSMLSSLMLLGQGRVKTDFVAQKLVVKLKPSQADYFESQRRESVFKFLVDHQERMFSKSQPLAFKTATENQVDLSLIYTLSVFQNVDLMDVKRELESLNVFEYVERIPVRYTTATPNDPNLNLQNYLAQINAFTAWDVTTGSATVKVGIVDTGTDMDHPDLQSKMSENANDPINGIDDDGDGYIDNFNGWDFVDQDGEPQIVGGSHGVHVAGIAAAATNNGEGVASIGYETVFMPIRAGDGNIITHGYEGIVYAADMGCDIINCSWGGFDASSLEQDVINYATYNKGALVVCAAGNQNRDQAYYPAAYENAFAVAAVSGVDKKSTISNYGYWVDMTAPGESIYSTVNDGGYNSNTGTSMAAPMVAGAAALVKAVYPQLSGKQIAEKLKLAGNDIYGSNPAYANKLGKSRLNVGNAVSGSIQQASVIFENMKITNKTDDVFKGNDSLFVSGTFTNYLSQSGNVIATIQTSSPYVTVNHDQEDLGVMNALLQLDNYDTPFSFKISDTAPINSIVTFEVVISDGVFTNSHFFDVVVNVDYLNIAINNIAMSLGSKGQVGYNGRNQNQGLGVQYKGGISQLFEGGLMIGTNQNGFVRVVDRVRNGNNSWDDDFKSEGIIQRKIPAPIGAYYLEGVFNDSNAQADTIGLQVLYNGYAYTDEKHQNYVVLEYEVVNTNNTALNDLHVGLFADFDVSDYTHNKSHTDLKRYMTYTKDTQLNTPCFGVQLLTPGEFHSYCMDNVDGGAGGVDIYNGYNNSKKYTTLSSNRYSSGIGSTDGNDVIQVTSMGNISIASGDTFKVAFAILAADAVVMLEETADSAYYRYNGSLPTSIIENDQPEVSVKMYPNPTDEVVFIEVPETEGRIQQVRIWDVTGKQVYRLEGVNNRHQINMSNFIEGVYLVEVQVESGVWRSKLVKNSN